MTSVCFCFYPFASNDSLLELIHHASLSQEIPVQLPQTLPLAFHQNACEPPGIVALQLHLSACRV
jgi:hypothetical protein